MIKISLISFISLVSLVNVFSQPTFPIRSIARIEGLVKNNVTNHSSQISGFVQFIQEEIFNGTKIIVNITFTPPYDTQTTLRGLHIHNLPITNNTKIPSIDCATAGPHWNPTNVSHGYPRSQVHHLGDMGNVISDFDGEIVVTFMREDIQLISQNGLVGHSVVLHEKFDDGGFGNEPTSKTAGNAGARIACGSIIAD